MKLKIICDSTAGLIDEYVLENNIEVIPLNVIINGTSYQDGVNITLTEVMDKFLAGEKVSSSQPSPETFVNSFMKAKEEGYTDIFCFTISSTLSGTFNSATLASKEVDGVNIYVIDTLSASLGSEMIIREALEYIKTHSIQETLEFVERLKENAVILLNMENLIALKKSGRITKIKAAIGNLIRVKPILEYINGKLSVITKFRTEGAVFKYVIERIEEELTKAKSKIRVYVSHVQSLDRIHKLKDLIEKTFDNIKVHISKEISPVVAINIGYGGYGVSWCYE